MGIVHIPRTVAASLRGYLKRRLSPLPENEASLIGFGPNRPPHIYKSRAGLFDIDLMGHMNNASYLTHAELARWEWSAANGVLSKCIKSKTFFIVTASTVRFRREIGPLQKFKIETRLGGIDERNMWVYHTFHNAPNEGKGKILAQIFTQAVMTKKGRPINPLSWLEEHFPLTEDVLEDVSRLSSGKVDDLLFDEKATRFTHLEDVLRKSAALHDEKVTK